MNPGSRGQRLPSHLTTRRVPRLAPGGIRRWRVRGARHAVTPMTFPGREGQSGQDGTEALRHDQRSTDMGKVGSSATMSLDGYIAFDDDTVGALFDWYDAGDVEVTTAHPDLTFHVTQPS